MLALTLIASSAQAEGWHGSAAGGYDLAFVPEVSGFGFVLFEATGEDKVGKGDVRLHYNTDTIHLEIERLPMGKDFEPTLALTDKELEALFPADPAQFDEIWPEFQFGAMFALMVSSGMRPGEARALEWCGRGGVVGMFGAPDGGAGEGRENAHYIF